MSKHSDVVSDIVRKISELKYEDVEKRCFQAEFMMNIMKFLKEEDYDNNRMVLNNINKKQSLTYPKDNQ